MKSLYVLRHAKAAPEGPEGDASRPLMKRGGKAAAAMGEYLAELEPSPRLVLCSTSLRTRETLDEILPALADEPQLVFEDALYLASATRLLDRLRHLPEEATSVLLIGHNPGVHQLAASLASEPGELAESFPTAALAVLHIAGRWSTLRPRQAKLIDFKTPKALSRDPDYDPD
ncbi:MAG TPA: histidine phosphatase family protein [Stellaceae bacterium]|nr:histidine phosphatase family protein [Stellaceae bacterium]